MKNVLATGLRALGIMLVIPLSLLPVLYVVAILPFAAWRYIRTGSDVRDMVMATSAFNKGLDASLYVFRAAERMSGERNA